MSYPEKTISITCQGCGLSSTVGIQHAGSEGICGRCSHVILVPISECEASAPLRGAQIPASVAPMSPLLARPVKASRAIFTPVPESAAPATVSAPVPTKVVSTAETAAIKTPSRTEQFQVKAPVEPSVPEATTAHPPVRGAQAPSASTIPAPVQHSVTPIQTPLASTIPVRPNGVQLQSAPQLQAKVLDRPERNTIVGKSSQSPAPAVFTKDTTSGVEPASEPAESRATNPAARTIFGVSFAAAASILIPAAAVLALIVVPLDGKATSEIAISTLEPESASLEVPRTTSPATPTQATERPEIPLPEAVRNGGKGSGRGPLGMRPAGQGGTAIRPAASRGTGASEGGGENMAILDFANNPVSDLLAVYERFTGKTILKDTAIFEGATISLVTPKEVKKADAVRLIEESLIMNGYALIDDPTTNTMKILSTRQDNQAAFSDGVTVHRNEADLPIGETLAGYFMELDNLDPVEAAQLFSDHIGLNSYGRITPVTNPPGLLITENASLIRQLIQIQNTIDVPSPEDSVVTQFIELEYADAATVSQIIQATIDARTELETTGEIRTFAGKSRQPDPKQQQKQNSNSNSSNNGTVISSEIPAQLVADARLNRIMVIARPADFDYIELLVKEFDQPVPPEDPLRRPLNYVYAEDILAVLVDSIQDAASAVALPGGGTLSAASNQLQSSARTGALTGLSGNQSGRSVTTSNTDATGESDQLIAPEENYAPISVLVGKTRIIADPRANSILAYGPKASLKKLSELIDELDQRPPQVYIATVIGQLQLGDGFEFGVDYLSQFQPFRGNNPSEGGITSSLFASGRSDATNSIADLRDNLITNPFSPANGLNLYGQIGNSLEAFVTALETTDRFEIVSRPVIYTANNKKAVITSGQRIPVPTSTLTNTTNTANNSNNVTTNIEYEDVVLKLEVVPLINSNGEITLTIAQVNDNVIGEQNVSNNTVPIIGTEQLTTTVTVPDRTTIVLGGLISESETDSDEGVPIISKIPLLGIPFRKTKREKSRSELLMFIQPTVVRGSTEVPAISLQEDLRTEIGAEAYRMFPDRSNSNRAAPPKPIPATNPIFHEGGRPDPRKLFR